MDASELSIILICLLFSAFFSGIEIAFLSADNLRIELKKSKGTINGRLLSVFTKNKSNFIATILVGNNLALVFYGIYMAKVFEPLISSFLPEFLDSSIIVLVIQTVIATIIVLVTAEFIPKSLFLINPDFLITFFAVPMAIIFYLFYPVVIMISGFSKFLITNIFKLEYSEEKPVFGLTDLNNYIKSIFHHNSEQGEDSEVNTRIINNALEFKSVKVRECMIPRTEIVGCEINDSVEEMKQRFIESKHSKIIIYKETIDDVIGYVHSLELFKKPRDIKSILTPIIIVPETMPANELMISFIQQRKSLALVVDEFGGTSGIVSMEDIIEEIFGDIQDEHDDNFLIEEKISDNTYLLSARHEVDYLNEKYNWDLPTGDYDTLGGLILAYNENLPKANDIIEIGPFVILISTMEENKIGKVKLTILDRLEEV